MTNINRIHANMKATLLPAILGGLLVMAPALLTVASPPALARGPLAAAGGEAPYQSTGVIEYVDLSKDTVVISDRGMSISATTPVHIGTRTVSRTALHKSMRVGFSADAVGHTRPAIREVWVLSGQ